MLIGIRELWDVDQTLGDVFVYLKSLKLLKISYFLMKGYFWSVRVLLESGGTFGK